MAVQFIDVGNEPRLEKDHGKKVLSNSRSFHTWIHGDYAGDKGTMHKHSADQTFYCIEGECTFHFPTLPAANSRPECWCISRRATSTSWRTPGRAT